MLTPFRSASSRASTPRSACSSSPDLMLASGARAWLALGRSQQHALSQAAIRGYAPALQAARGRHPLYLDGRSLAAWPAVGCAAGAMADAPLCPPPLSHAGIRTGTSTRASTYQASSSQEAGGRTPACAPAFHSPVRPEFNRVHASHAPSRLSGWPARPCGHPGRRFRRPLRRHQAQQPLLAQEQDAAGDSQLPSQPLARRQLTPLFPLVQTNPSIPPLASASSPICRSPSWTERSAFRSSRSCTTPSTGQPPRKRWPRRTPRCWRPTRSAFSR